MSEPPPGANGTMRRIGRSGQVACAWLRLTAMAPASPPAAQAKTYLRRWGMGASLLHRHHPPCARSAQSFRDACLAEPAGNLRNRRRACCSGRFQVSQPSRIIMRPAIKPSIHIEDVFETAIYALRRRRKKYSTTLYSSCVIIALGRDFFGTGTWSCLFCLSVRLRTFVATRCVVIQARDVHPHRPRATADARTAGNRRAIPAAGECGRRAVVSNTC
jgi:hypothetical protein